MAPAAAITYILMPRWAVQAERRRQCRAGRRARCMWGSVRCPPSTPRADARPAATGTNGQSCAPRPVWSVLAETIAPTPCTNQSRHHMGRQKHAAPVHTPTHWRCRRMSAATCIHPMQWSSGSAPAPRIAASPPTASVLRCTCHVPLRGPVNICTCVSLSLSVPGRTCHLHRKVHVRVCLSVVGRTCLGAEEVNELLVE
jgi:hypothetical protein